MLLSLYFFSLSLTLSLTLSLSLILMFLQNEGGLVVEGPELLTFLMIGRDEAMKVWVCTTVKWLIVECKL